MENQRIPLTVPETGEPEAAAARRVILTGWLTMGPETEAFEKEFAATVGTAHACATSSGTSALHLALLAAGIGAGDEVVTTSHSFVATANAVRQCGATPVFVDIDPVTFNLDPAQVQTAITARTRAILCVHQMGMPCDLAAILDIARRRGLPLIEDACCAIGSEILSGGDWERIGRPHGDAACFSFHPRKVLTTGDGGMLTTRHADWDQKFRQLRQHGMTVPAHQRHVSGKVIFERYDAPGYNYRMTDVQAAIGREQLKRLPQIIAQRRAIAERYAKLLAGMEHVAAPHEPTWARSNWQSYCVRLGDARDQRALMEGMLERGVATRRGIMCAHLEPAYPEATWRGGPEGLHESEKARDHAILLPLFPRMTEAQQDFVVKAFGEVCAMK